MDTKTTEQDRPTAVWIKRNDALHTMECSNCGADAHHQIVDGVWRYEPYCAHCGARVYKQEDLSRQKSKTSRWTEEEVENAKAIKRIFEKGDFEFLGLNEDGCPVLSDAGYREYGCATTIKKSAFPSLKPGENVWIGEIIMDKDLIKRRPRWTEQDVEIAKAIKLLAPATKYIERVTAEWSVLYSRLAFCATCLPIPCIPSMKPGERIALDDIIGDRE